MNGNSIWTSKEVCDNENAIFNWTYADEQKAKLDWNNNQEEENPYVYLPRLNLYIH